MLKIDIDVARWALRRAVETQGDGFVYTSTGTTTEDIRAGTATEDTCRYAKLVETEEYPAVAGDPRYVTGCLIGTSLDLLNMGWVYEGHEGIGIISIGKLFPDVISNEAADYLAAAQHVQDDGGTWGRALAAAEQNFYTSQMAHRHWAMVVAGR